MTQWVAEAKVVFVQPDKSRVAGRIAVAAPVVRDADCACEVAMDGLERSFMVYGESTLQALLLGVRFLVHRLHDHRSRGVRIERDGDDADAVDEDVLEVLFGPLLRAASTDVGGSS
jgi:hypothetical protein